MQIKELTAQWGIALTGGIASGKSTIAQHLRLRNYLVIDADQLSRSIVAPGSEGLAAVSAHFGSSVLSSDGQLDRARMRQLIFNDPQQRAALEAIVHPRLLEATRQVLAADGLLTQPRLWFYEAALIFERGRAEDFREVWLASCPEAVQITRVMRRDQCTQEEALAIIRSQLPLAEKIRQATRVIDTDCPLGELGQRIDLAISALPSHLRELP